MQSNKLVPGGILRYCSILYRIKRGDMVATNTDGAIFPELSLPDLSGNKIDIASYSEKRLIVFMWASW